MSPQGGQGGVLQVLTGWVTMNAAWIITISAVYFVVSLLVIRFIIIRMPHDYFVGGRPAPSGYGHPLAAVALRLAKNLLGAVVILVGLVMSVPGVPGQGLLTLLIGLTLTEFPGKRRMELWFLRQPVVLRAINGLRSKAGKAPLVLPDREEAGAGGGEGGPNG